MSQCTTEARGAPHGAARVKRGGAGTPAPPPNTDPCKHRDTCKRGATRCMPDNMRVQWDALESPAGWIALWVSWALLRAFDPATPLVPVAVGVMAVVTARDACLLAGGHGPPGPRRRCCCGVSSGGWLPGGVTGVALAAVSVACGAPVAHLHTPGRIVGSVVVGAVCGLAGWGVCILLGWGCACWQKRTRHRACMQEGTPLRGDVAARLHRAVQTGNTVAPPPN